MNAEKYLAISTITSFLILIISYYYHCQHEKNMQNALSEILYAMLEVERNYSVENVRIAIGYGACQDLFVKAHYIFGKVPPPNKFKHYDVINSMDQLKEMYAMFFAAGSAAERYIANRTFFDELYHIADKTPDSYYALGGNAPIMALRFAREGAEVLLSANQNKYLKEKDLQGIKVSGKINHSGEDDVHIILEYVAGEKWGPYTAPRANRFIIHNDISNPTIESTIGFDVFLKEFRPHLFVVGGLQMMDHFPFPSGFKRQKLQEVMEQMTMLPFTTKIHFEMASYADLDLLNDLTEFIIPYSDSLGMNEQELPNLFSVLKYGNTTLISDSRPRIAVVLDQMRAIFRILNYEHGLAIKNKERRLTRLHVHTLAFQAIMIDKSSSWKNTEAAVTKAALTAHRHVCGNDKINIKNAKLLMNDAFSLNVSKESKRIVFKNRQPVSCWDEDNEHIQICIAPVLVCTSVRQTAGGGDNISAAGLVFQV